MLSSNMNISTIFLLASAPLLILATPIGFHATIEERAVEADNITVSPECYDGCCVVPPPLKRYCGKNDRCKQINS